MTTRPTRVFATHVLFGVHLLGFIILAVGASAPWYPDALLGLGLSDASGLVARPWTLVTHAFVHRHPLEFMISAAILLLAGPPVEQRLGTRLTLAFLLVSVALTGLLHVVLLAAGLVGGLLFSGSIATGAALLTAYLLLLGGERRVGSLPFPFFYVLTAAALFALVATLGLDMRRTLEEQVANLRSEALRGENLSPHDRIDKLVAVARCEQLRADLPTHLLGLAVGGVSLLCCGVLGRMERRVRVLREIRSLQDEVEARARVEELLGKISRDGLSSLSRQERRFLTYASQRYYRSGRLTRATSTGAS